MPTKTTTPERSASKASAPTAPAVSDRRRSPVPLAPVTPVEVHAVGAMPGDAVAVRIETPRLVLRSLAESDRDAWAESYDASRTHLDEFMPLGGAEQRSDEIFARQLELTRLGDESGRAFRRAAFDRESGGFVGSFNLVTIRRGLELEADLSVWLSARYLGRGLATEGMLALMSYSFADLPDGLGLHRIDGWCVPENTRCQRLLAACGFEASGSESMHLTTGDRWQLHERWSANVDAWLESHA